MLVGCGVYASGQNLLSGCALVLAMVATALTILRMAVINADLGPHHNNGTTENDAVAWQGSRTPTTCGKVSTSCATAGLTHLLRRLV